MSEVCLILILYLNISQVKQYLFNAKIVSSTIPGRIKICNYYFITGLGNPHKQGESANSKEIGEAAVLSGVAVTRDLPGNPGNVARHASGNKHPDERAAAAAVLEEPIAAAQENRIEIPQAAKVVPETLVQTRQADAPELSVDGQETKAENQRAPREIPDTVFRDS